MRGHREVLDPSCQSASGQAARDREPRLAESRRGCHTALGRAGRPVRPGRGPVCGNGLRLGPLVRLAGRCLGAEPLVSRRHLIPTPVRAAGGLNGLVHHRLLTDRPARGAGCSSWVLRTLPRSPRASASAWAADSGVSSPWAYYPTLCRFCRGPLVFLAQPGLYDGSVAQGAGSPAHGGPGAGCPAGLGGHSGKKTPARGRGPKPQSSERGQLPFESDVVAFGRQQLAGGGRSAPGLRPAVRRTGCANRNVGVQRPFPVCESLPRTIWVQGLFPHRNQDKS